MRSFRTFLRCVYILVVVALFVVAAYSCQRGDIEKKFGLKDAYDLAVENGFEGTQAEWLESLIGATGAQGPQGEKGETGAQGEKGDKGDTGETGAQGPQGEKGETGAQGPQGEKGETGDTGATGPQGPQGDKGETGAQGPQGDKGETGEAGVGIADIKVEQIEDGYILIFYFTDGSFKKVAVVTPVALDKVDATVTDENGEIQNVDKLESDISIISTNNADFVADIEAGALFEDGATTATLVVTKAEPNFGNFSFSASDKVFAFDIKVAEISKHNESVIIVKASADQVPAGLENLVIFHEGKLMTAVASAAEVNADGEFFYDAVNGGVVIGTKNFSNFTIASGDYISVSTINELTDALLKGYNVRLEADLEFSANDTPFNSGYGATGISVKGNVLDGNGHTIRVKNAGATWACAIHTTGGTIKNLTIAGAMRGIFTGGTTSDLYIDNVKFDGVIYTYNSDGEPNGTSANYGVYITNSTMNGWTSFSNMHKEVIFTNCTFTSGSGYAYCRPYQSTTFNNCEFTEGYKVDLTNGQGDKLPAGSVLPPFYFNDCTSAGEVLTYFNLNFAYGKDCTLVERRVIINSQPVPAVIDNADDLRLALAIQYPSIKLACDIELAADITAPYGNKTALIQKGGVLDGDNHKLIISGSGDSYGIMTYGGTIKNITIEGSFRGIVTMTPTEDVIIDNVTAIEDVLYTINSTEYPVVEGVDLIVKNSTLGGWTSFAGFASVTFTNCDFVCGSSGYGWPYDCLIRPYNNVTFANCSFSEGFYIDFSALEAGCRVILSNCDIAGVKITAENYETLFTTDYTLTPDEFVTDECKGIMELPGDGRTVADCVIFA